MRARWTQWLGVLTLLGCSERALDASGVVLALYSGDLAIPTDTNLMGLYLRVTDASGKVISSQAFEAAPLRDGDTVRVPFPATLAINARPDHDDDRLHARLIAYRGAAREPLTMREARVAVSSSATKLLRLNLYYTNQGNVIDSAPGTPVLAEHAVGLQALAPLDQAGAIDDAAFARFQSICDGAPAPAGKTAGDDGRCVALDVADLPDYDPNQPVPGARAGDSCYDVERAFAPGDEVVQIVRDALAAEGSCILQVPASFEDAQVNVATLGARGAFPAADYPGRALRPLARGVAFTTQGQTVVLPAHVCDRVRSDADAVLLSRRTTTWTGAVPVCAPWTTAEARGEYADPPASDGGIDSDVRDGQTDANNGDDDGGSIFQQINGTVNELPYAVAGIWMHGTDHAAVAVDVMDTGESFPTREIHNLVNGESSYTYRPLINGIDLDSFIVNESVEFYMRNQQTDEISHLRFDSATSREPIDTGTPGVTGATGVMFGFQNRGFVLSALVDRNVSLSKLETATKLQRLFTYDAIAPVTFHQRPAARAAAGGLMEVLAVGYDGTVHCIDDECRRGYLIDEGGTTLSLDSNLVAFGGEFFANDRRLIPDGQNWKAQPWLDPALDLQITSLATTEKLLCAVANQNVYCWTDPSSQTPHRLFNEDAMKLAIHGSGKRLRIAYSCSQPPNAVFYASIHEATIIANEEPFVNCTLPY